MWRKNRRPAPRGRGARSIGVDLNRNFPMMWRFDRHFAPGTVESSHLPSDFETYVGPRPASEPETRNVIWLLDRYPQIRYFVDLHAYGETILHSWGTDENQSDNPTMNFANAAFDGKRGRIHDDDYREHIDPDDERQAIRLARRMSSAIALVRGRSTRCSSRLDSTRQPACSDDYAYSRHLTDVAKTKTSHLPSSGVGAEARLPSTPRTPRCARSCARWLRVCWNSAFERSNAMYVQHQSGADGQKMATDPRPADRSIRPARGRVVDAIRRHAGREK